MKKRVVSHERLSTRYVISKGMGWMLCVVQCEALGVLGFEETDIAGFYDDLLAVLLEVEDLTGAEKTHVRYRLVRCRLEIDSLRHDRVIAVEIESVVVAIDAGVANVL